jgi:hypothetical protein
MFILRSHYLEGKKKIYILLVVDTDSDSTNGLHGVFEGNSVLRGGKCV